MSKRALKRLKDSDIIKKAKGECLANIIPDDLYKKLTSLPINNGNWKVIDAYEHLIKVDSRFKDVIIEHGIPSVYEKVPIDISSKNYFHELMKIIVYQQLAGNVAEQIFAKVLTALNTNTNEYCKPESVLNASIDVNIVDGKRKILVNGKESGLSLSKANYMKSLAEHFNDSNCLKDIDLHSLDDDELIRRLVAVKGLGLWSVHMFMIFTLRRPNVLAVGDLGIRNGLSYFLGRSKDSFEGKKQQQDIVTLCSHWAPFSSVACALMWKIADAKKAIKTKLPTADT